MVSADVTDRARLWPVAWLPDGTQLATSGGYGDGTVRI